MLTAAPEFLGRRRGPIASRISEETRRPSGTIRNAKWSGRGEGMTGAKSWAITRIRASGGASGGLGN